MNYFDLLRTRKYFDIFLKHFNSNYAKPSASPANTVITMPQGTNEKDLMAFRKWLDRKSRKSGEEREPHYEILIKRYYMIDQRTPSAPIITSDHVAALISNQAHITDAYKSLEKEFGLGRRGLRLAPLEEFSDSIQSHEQELIRLAGHRMESIAPVAIPQELLDGLKLLFCRLQVVPSKAEAGEARHEGPKLVAVSKVLHFLLPDLVMPIDRARVLRFLGIRSVPQDTDEQFDLFTKVFRQYIELAHNLQLTSNNGDGNWWNVSVPKRIDNAILGFWTIFSEPNVERIICGNIDNHLSFLGIA